MHLNTHNWYIKYLLASRKIYIPDADWDNLMNLIDKLAKGNTNWTPEELQLQANYPEAIEVLLRKKQKES